MLDNCIQEILTKIEENGYEAFIIGGYVRDFLMHQKSLDVDICTSAPIEIIKNIIPGKVNKYHSLQTKVGEYNIDITPYRLEHNYHNRRPLKISYTSDLEKDLERRDFTINAICLDKNNQIIDKLNGLQDFQTKTIKMIGDLNTKLTEDPLRILRAIRFLTTLNFNLEENLHKAIIKHQELLKTLSNYRIKEELSKILTSKNYQKGLDYLKKYDLCKYLNISYTSVFYTPDLLGMFAQITCNLPFTKQEKNTILKIREIVKNKKIDENIFYQYGFTITYNAGLILGLTPNYLTNLYQNMPIKTVKHLNISHQELLKYFPKTKISIIKNHLINEINSHNLSNTNQSIKDYLIKNKARWLQ